MADDDIIEKLQFKIRTLEQQLQLHATNIAVVADALSSTNTAAGTLATAAGNASAQASAGAATTRLHDYQTP